MAGLTLDTSPMNPATSEEEDEVMDEVISLSPAVRAPVLRFRRTSSALSMHPEASTMTLDTVLEGGGYANGGKGNGEVQPYTGQEVNPEDLVAVNLENAFDRL